MTSISATVREAGAGSDARISLPLLSRNWKWFVLRGTLALILGAVALLFPVSALLAFTMVFAAYAGADGIFSVIAGIRGATRKKERWWAFALRGLVGLAVAAIFVLMPFAATVSYALATLGLLSTWAILTGMLEVIAAIRLRQVVEGEWLLGLSGLLSILLGLAVPIAFYVNPPATMLSVAWMVAFYAIIAGVALVILGLRLRRRMDKPDTGVGGL